MRSFALATTLALVAVLAATLPAAAGAIRPISGEYTVSVVAVEQRCGANALAIGFAGSGIARYLGRMTGTGSNCTEFVLTTAEVNIWDGTVTFVAADGSTLTASYTGVQRAPVGSSAVVETSNTVVSGTGRFEGATGYWTGSGVIDFATGVFTGTLSGWVSY